jgi:hypothetical protein
MGDQEMKGLIAQNVTLGTLVKIARALGHEVDIAFTARRTVGTRRLRVAAKA